MTGSKLDVSPVCPLLSRPDRKEFAQTLAYHRPLVVIISGKDSLFSGNFAMILLIDNYDSFTWNLVHYLGQLGAVVEVVRNDELTVGEAIAKRAQGIVLSPGPCDPDKAGICLDLVSKAGSTTPILGVCLGHQSIGQVYGGKVVRASVPMHGKISTVRNSGKSVFKNLPKEFSATRYHSLVVDRSSLPNSLTITADTEDGTIMGICHREHPVHGVQFHPESIATEHGHALLRNFLELTAES